MLSNRMNEYVFQRENLSASRGFLCIKDTNYIGSLEPFISKCGKSGIYVIVDVCVPPSFHTSWLPVDVSGKETAD